MLDKFMCESEEAGFYTVLGEILFFPKEHYILNIKSDYRVNLKPTVSHCFHLLLKKNGIIVSQNELMAFAWGEKHRQVSYNTFYQNILHLRRALIMVGLEQAIVTTVPKKGVMIRADVSVKADAFTAIEAYTLQNPPLTVKLSEPPLNKNVAAKIFTPRVLLIVLLTILLFLLSYFSSESEEKVFFSDYHSASLLEKNCNIFFNNDVVNHEKHDLFIKSHKELCHEDKYVYITASANTHNMSVIICPVKIGPESNKTCLSVYYPWYQHAAK